MTPSAKALSSPDVLRFLAEHPLLTTAEVERRVARLATRRKLTRAGTRTTVVEPPGDRQWRRSSR